MTREDDRAREEFTSEAEELLDTLSRDLVEFEAQGKDVRPEVVNKIFREIHSLKGLAGMLGFVEISELSHNLEDMLDKLRMGKIAIDRIDRSALRRRRQPQSAGHRHQRSLPRRTGRPHLAHATH